MRNPSHLSSRGRAYKEGKRQPSVQNCLLPLLYRQHHSLELQPSPLPQTLPSQPVATIKIRSSGRKRLYRPPTPPRTSSRQAVRVSVEQITAAPDRTLKRKPKRSSLRLIPSEPKLRDPKINMSSPVKSGPTALDRSGDRFGDRSDNRDGPLTHPGHGLPMPGLSGNANSPSGPGVAKQAISSKAPSTTTASSRALPSWSGSSSTSKPRCTSRRVCVATCSSDYISCSPLRSSPPSHGCLTDPGSTLFVFFLGGEVPPTGNDSEELEFGVGGGADGAGNKTRVRLGLRTERQGFVFAVGGRSVSIFRIILTFTVYFINDDVDRHPGNLQHHNDNSGEGRGKGENEDLDRKGVTAQKPGQHKDREKGQEVQSLSFGAHDGGNSGNKQSERKAEDSHSLSLTMTITIMVANTLS
ncbi:hypothetical protein F5Y17DRAFT_244548 [Xylariaceae sp. FL0594]|nr:hypothetical protein F5Y17DRAFT_244548 [Xylariaceae sp. FL0594]